MRKRESVKEISPNHVDGSDLTEKSDVCAR